MKQSAPIGQEQVDPGGPSSSSAVVDGRATSTNSSRDIKFTSHDQLSTTQVQHSWRETAGYTADIFTIVGFPLTLLSLFVAWRQLKKTQGATEAAIDAAKRAVRRLGSIEVAAELGACNELLKLVMNDIPSSLFDSARSRILDVVIRMTRISAGDGHIDQIRQSEITSIVINLQRCRELLNSNITPQQVQKADKMVAENIQKLATVQGAIKIAGVSENG